MTEDEYVALARQKYHDLQQLKTQPTFYDYEKSFDDIWQDLGRQVLEKSLSNVPADRRKIGTPNRNDENPVWANTNC